MGTLDLGLIISLIITLISLFTGCPEPEISDLPFSVRAQIYEGLIPSTPNKMQGDYAC